MFNNSLIELDRAHLIHPVASYRGHEQQGVRVLASAKGATVTDASGHQLVDGFAGLWCVNAGYGHESIVEAAARQMRELPYATAYFGLGSEPAIRLASELADRAPGDLKHIYFTLGGSDAVDSTIRFIRYYWIARGQPQRDQFISIEQGYHGSSTVGAGLTALPNFHAVIPSVSLLGRLGLPSSRHRLRPCAPRSRRSVPIGSQRFMPSRSRARAASSYRRRAGCRLCGISAGNSTSSLSPTR